MSFTIKVLLDTYHCFITYNLMNKEFKSTSFTKYCALVARKFKQIDFLFLQENVVHIVQYELTLLFFIPSCFIHD